SGSNTVAVADGVLDRIKVINDQIKDTPGNPRVFMVRDSSVWIRANIEEVGTTIIIGIILAVVVVYLFLGNPRSTIITGMALPNSLLGAFILMYAMGFTINVMTLLALSLSVGLLVDDAIVVRENIFRKLEDGMPVVEAAERGTNEVALAVIATTLTVVAVFLPVGFLSGIVGQFFKQFGLTVVFAMLISLFDAMTIAPMLSAYFAGHLHEKPNRLIQAFDRFQNFLEHTYGRFIGFSLRHPLITLAGAAAVFFASLGTLGIIKKTFMPPNDQGEFMVYIQMPPGTSINGTQAAVFKIEEKLKALPETNLIATVIGSQNGESNVATLGITLLKSWERNRSTTEIKEVVRGFLKEMPDVKSSVNDYSAVGGGVQYPLNLNLTGDDLAELEKYSKIVIEKISDPKRVPDLIDVQTDFRGGKPEYQIQMDPARMEAVGVTAGIAGAELRYLVEGGVVGRYHDAGLEYDVRLRLRPDQRDLKSAYGITRVPNMTYKMIPLPAISSMVLRSGPERITRQDRGRVITIHANLAPGGAIGNATDVLKKMLDKEIPPPKGIRYAFWGQSEDFKELMENILLAFGMAILFIYLVLASLYESFITPLTILLAIPPAISGAFFALALTGEMLNIFSMIGLIMLMGLVTKNSILLVDFALQGIRSGMSHADAIKRAGMLRLRPILMTSLAMIAGIMPVALGLSELAKARRAMGVAIVGGLIVSTFLTLVMVPVMFGYIDRLREWIEKRFRPDFDMSRVGRLDETHAAATAAYNAPDNLDALDEADVSGYGTESEKKRKPRKRS
ncbi:MAG: efflux RND transporter permease subunit, partial [Spirochaetia bacterium]|nr:efflux RND transporter permease subunit [Spirochaetia bacterium]